MIYNNYENEYIRLDPIKLLEVLELAKIPTSEYIIIPRTIHQNHWYNCIIGINNNTIYSISKYSIINENEHVVLWDEPSINYIAFSVNQLNPFIKALKEELHNIGKITLYYHKYNVNNHNTSIGTLISADNKIKIKNSQGILDWVPILELSNYKNIMFHFKCLLENWKNSKILFTKSLKEDKEFREIWDRKAGEGAMAWIPNPENYPDYMRPYIIYLSKAMFAVAKNDDIIVELRNEVPNESYDKFLIKFTVIKTKSKNFISYHDYYMMGIKIINL